VSPVARHPLPDVLRALALLSVIVVNAAGYAVAPLGPILGLAQPHDEPVAWAVQGLQAWLLQGKAYPALAFLFGWGLAMSLRASEGDASLVRARRRQKRLLLLGVMHGTLLYFGDILTMYALCGLWVLNAARLRWTALRRRLRNTAALALGTTLAFTVLGSMWQVPPFDEPGFAQTTSFLDFFLMNAPAYLTAGVLGSVMGAPVIVLCMLGGVAAARLRLLTSARWSAWRRRQVKRWLLPLLLWNAAYAVAQVNSANASEATRLWVDSATPLFGLPLAAVAVLGLAQAWADGRLSWAAPLGALGRRTLTVYIGHSLWCVLVYSGAGLDWQPGTLGLFVVSVSFWALAAWAAAHSQSRWPLEVWMGRRL
jgi:uncharacterized protein